MRVVVLLAVSMSLVALTACGARYPAPAEVEAFERAVRAQSEFAAVEVTYEERSGAPRLYTRIDLRADSTSDRAAVSVRDALSLLHGEAFADVGGYVRVTIGEGHASINRGHPPVQLEFELPHLPPPATVESETRIWHDLAATFPRLTTEIRTDDPDDLHDRSVGVELEDGSPDAVTDAFHTLARPHWPPAETVSGVFGDGMSLVSHAGLPPEAVMLTMRSLAQVGGALGRDDHASVYGRWGYAEAGCLTVEVALDLAELRAVPDEEVRSRLPGSSAERLTHDYLARLDASGIPYSLTARSPSPDDSYASPTEYYAVERCDSAGP